MQIKDITRENDGNYDEIVLTITADADEVKQSADSFFADIAKRDIPGFRKGKAPREMLEQAVGGHANAMGGVTEVLINEHALQTIDDSGVIFLDEPTFNVDEMVEIGQPFTFTVSGMVAPVMKLTSYDPVSIEMPPEDPTEQEVEDQIVALQDYYHSFENIEDDDHKAELGDYMMTDLTVSDRDTGHLVGNMNKVRRLIGLGEGTMPDSFDEKVVGAKKGDHLEFDFEAKDAEGNSEYGNGNLHAIVEVLGFRKRVVPEVDDDFAVKVGCMDVKDMRDQLKRQIGMQKAEELPKLKVDRAIDAVLERLDGEVPEYYVDFIRQDVGREFMQSLQEKGTNLQEWMIQNAINGDEMKDDISVESKRRAAIDCALEAIFTEKGLEITEEDIDSMFGGDDPAAVREEWEKAHRMATIMKMCRQQKATEWLTDNANVTVVED